MTTNLFQVRFHICKHTISIVRSIYPISSYKTWNTHMSGLIWRGVQKTNHDLIPIWKFPCKEVLDTAVYAPYISSSSSSSSSSTATSASSLSFWVWECWMFSVTNFVQFDFSEWHGTLRYVMLWHCVAFCWMTFSSKAFTDVLLLEFLLLLLFSY